MSKTDEDYYVKIVNILKNFNIDIVLLCRFTKNVTPELFNEYKTINIIPSLSPFKHPDTTYIYKFNNDDIYTGCTLYEICDKNEISKNHNIEILLQKQCVVDTNNEFIIQNTIQELEKQCITDYINILNNEKKIIHYDVDIEKGNEFVKFIRKINTNIGDFSSIITLNNKNYGFSCDGCGTKLILANNYNKFNGIGIDLVAMNVNDLIANGVKPLYFMDYIAIDKMNLQKTNKIINSIQKGCQLANCKLIGGETAEMKDVYLKNGFDIAGFAIGEQIYKLPIKDKMNKKCFLYGMKSSGIHSNGYTLVRKLIQNNIDEITNDIINTILKPTKIYIEAFDYIRKYNIVGISHITGGGFNDNINRILPENLNFKLINWEFPPIFKWIQQKSNLPKKKMLEIFNCGYGMVLISEDTIPELDIIGYLEYDLKK